MHIAKTVNEQETVLAVEGRIDVTNSKILQDAIISAFQSTTNLVVDFEKVVYIASAGLRALLLGQKTAVSKSGMMKLIHVCDDVMEVLRMTGFQSALHIE
ncbi:MAG: STAS domain-containing protein [Lachnospiraceae bacterium]|nr:STAS domain-containing protein [Lachnospiraceae bacterium]